MIKFSTEKPKIYERLKEVFGVEWDNGLIIANGDTIHCKYQLSDNKILHEMTHIGQQEKMGLDKWWDKYIAEPEFRLEQEKEAYAFEQRFINDHIKDRNKRFQMLNKNASDLAGPIYGRLISHSEAVKFLRSI